MSHRRLGSQSNSLSHIVYFLYASRDIERCAIKNSLVIPDFGTVTGPFQITSFEFAGEHNGEVTYELALESAGALAFAAI